MIDDSTPWKELLSRKAASLTKRGTQRRWTAASSAAVEQDIMLSAYAVRKLLEAGKISDEFVSTPVNAIAFAFKGERRYYVETGDLPDLSNWHRIEEFYNLEEGQEVRIGLRDFCNQIVHSWIFLLSVSEAHNADGFFVASDRERGERLLHFSIEEAARVLHGVANDDIVWVHRRRDLTTGQWRYVTKSRVPPDGETG